MLSGFKLYRKKPGKKHVTQLRPKIGISGLVHRLQQLWVVWQEVGQDHKTEKPTPTHHFPNPHTASSPHSAVSFEPQIGQFSTRTVKSHGRCEHSTLECHHTTVQCASGPQLPVTVRSTMSRSSGHDEMWSRGLK